jgi:hypothetical protein
VAASRCPSLRIELPLGERIDRLPQKTSIKSNFGELEVGFSLDGSTVVAAETLTFTLSRIPPEKYLDFRDFVNSTLRAERQRLRVGKGSP